MGYTHRWEHGTINPSDWEKVTARIAPLLRDRTEPLGLCDVEVTEELVFFNGQHETFSVSPAATSFDFCKTAQKLYDPAVVACLVIFAEEVESFSWSSDGRPDEHAEGIALAGSYA